MAEPAAEVRCPDPLDGAGGTFVEHRIQVEPDVELRAFEWSGLRQVAPPLVLVAGWITVVDSWVPVLESMARDRRVLYLESREKTSARMEGSALAPARFRLDRLGRDITEVLRAVDWSPGEAVFVGSSLGGNAILEMLKQGERCRGAFLIGPNAEFAFPLWARYAMRLPARLYQSLVPFLLWYLKRFRLDAEAEPEQYERYCTTLVQADYCRLKCSAMALVDAEVMKGLDRINDPVAVAFASSDRLHGEANARRLAEGIPAGHPLPCPSNAYLHGPEVVDEIDRFVGGR